MEKNALMVPAKEPEAIAESIIKMYNNPNQAMKLKEEGILTAKKFTWERVVDVFEKEFPRFTGQINKKIGTIC